MLILDLETFSPIPITYGVYKYAEAVEVLLVSYALDEGAVLVEDTSGPGEWGGFAPKLQRLIDDADKVLCHNSNFERTVLRACGVTLPLEKIVDSMIVALQHSLPGSLGALCDVLGVPSDTAKDKAGKKLIQLFTKPLPKNRKLERATRDTHPEQWAEFIEYARTDVAATRDVYGRLPRWNHSDVESTLWRLDQNAADCGCAVDIDLVRGAGRSILRASGHHAAATRRLTGGAVESLTQRQKFLDHLSEAHGYTPKDMTKETVASELARDDLSETVRDLLTVRQQASSTSVAKYAVFDKATSVDGRIRGMLQFCGASRTFRDSGRIVQLQNLPRPTLPNETIELGIDAIKHDCEDLLFDNPTELLSSAVRGCLVAPPGKKLVVADLSNIEGRVLAWLAGEEWKLKAFRDFDAGKGHDLYKITAGRILGKDPSGITKDERGLQGKVPELAGGFGGALGAYRKMGGPVFNAMTDDDIILIVKAWRSNHPATVRFWYDLERAVKAAIRDPQSAYALRGIRCDMRNGYLRIRKPGGGYLSYKDARVDDDKPCPHCNGEGRVLVGGLQGEGGVAQWELCRPCQGSRVLRGTGQVFYSGNNQYTRKWETLETYYGRLTENLVQSVARDVFMHGFRLAKEAGWNPVLRVHDELICETPDTPDYTAEGLSALMTKNPPWAGGLPLAAAGHEMYRYAKGD